MGQNLEEATEVQIDGGEKVNRRPRVKVGHERVGLGMRETCWLPSS